MNVQTSFRIHTAISKILDYLESFKVCCTYTVFSLSLFIFLCTYNKYKRTLTRVIQPSGLIARLREGRRQH